MLNVGAYSPFGCPQGGKVCTSSVLWWEIRAKRRKERGREKGCREDNLCCIAAAEPTNVGTLWSWSPVCCDVPVWEWSKGPVCLHIIMYDPVEEEGHLVRHIMVSLSACKCAAVSQCHFSFPSLWRIMPEWGGPCRRVFMCFMGYKPVSVSRCFQPPCNVFSSRQGDPSVGGDNDKFTYIVLIHKQT